ncbi:MFS transporter [Streptomyces sp. Ag109_G2-15]|uniref:MFS transporter n=1 Tax=Streptomyces sp. Ag109_G2-15 TaxID=1938850 RepID=UPI000BD19F6A|nr:MFS transporter [Streptomyces sp. Ag109_G2-15]SOD91238.1 Major Facilitator Superfamily protein [Streptomyces sp. Ag109_G2-15]
MTTTPVSSASDQHDSPEASRATRAGGLLPADPVLRLATVLTVVNSLGNGLYFPLGILYFTRIVGLDATAVGVGMTVAGLVGVAAGVPAGRAADRWGARRVGALMWGGTGIATAAYTLVHSYAGFLVTVICATAFQMASRGVQGALYADVLPAATRVEARAYLRMVTNVGMGVGGALGAVALQLDTRGAYLAVIVLNALSFAGPALLVPRMPLASHVRERAALDADAPAVDRWRAVRDLPFLAVTVLNAVLVVQYTLSEVGLPLWIVERTEAPRWTAALLMIVNCVLVALLQVRVARRASQVPSAVRAMGWSGLLLAASCAVYALSAGLSPVWAVLSLTAGAVVQVFAEVLSAAGGWTLGYELADARAHGVYQGVFGAGMSAGMMAGPALVTVTAIAHGTLGWAVLGVVFALAGLAVTPAVRWAQRDGAWRGEPA